MIDVADRRAHTFGADHDPALLARKQAADWAAEAGTRASLPNSMVKLEQALRAAKGENGEEVLAARADHARWISWAGDPAASTRAHGN